MTIADAGKFNALLEKFRKADSKYNSGLFDQALSEPVVCNASSAFWTIIRQLYFPESPYSFSVFSSDILGHIYEIFIAEKLAMVDGELQIVKKPENEDRDVARIVKLDKMNIFLPKYFDKRNKYITFAA